MKNNFTNNLKKLRKDKSLSQEQLADILGVSRQSISKWETGDAYPEMEKIIFLCKEYDLNVNDLLNGDIYETKQNNEAFKEMYKAIDKTVNFFVDSFSLFFKMTFKSKIIFILEIIFLFLVLGTIFFIAGEILGQISSSLLYSLVPHSLYSVVSNIFSFLFYFVASILSLAIVIKMVKIRYLKYYNKEVELENTSNEPSNNENIEKVPLNKTNKNKIVLRDPQDSSFKILNIFYRIIIISLKMFLFFVLIPFIFLLILLAFTLIASFLLYKTGFLFLGLIVSILSTMSLTITFILLIANFLFDRKNNYKLFIYTSLVNLVIVGLGIGFIFIGSLSFNFINKYDKNYFTTHEELVEMDNKLIVIGMNVYNSIEYVVEDRDNIKITYDINNIFINDGYNLSTENYVEEGYKVVYISFQSDNYFKIIKKILTDINNKKIINYSDEVYNLKVYGSKENIKKIKENFNKRYDN